MRFHDIFNLLLNGPPKVTSLVAQMVKHLPPMRETRVLSLGEDDPLEKEMQPTPVLLPGKFHGWRVLVGYSPWSCKESDTTERLNFPKCRQRQSESSAGHMEYSVGNCQIQMASRCHSLSDFSTFL